MSLTTEMVVYVNCKHTDALYNKHYPSFCVICKQNLCNLKLFLEFTSADGQEDMTDIEAPVVKWLPSNHLTEVEKRIIINNNWLNDRIIDAAQTMLHTQ